MFHALGHGCPNSSHLYLISEGDACLKPNLRGVVTDRDNRIYCPIEMSHIGLKTIICSDSFESDIGVLAQTVLSLEAEFLVVALAHLFKPWKILSQGLRARGGSSVG